MHVITDYNAGTKAQIAVKIFIARNDESLL